MLVRAYRMKHQTLLLTALAATTMTVPGCTNQPGALKLTLTTSTQEFRVHDPIVINVTITAADHPVVLAQDRYFKVDLTRLEPVPETVKGPDIACCGTGELETLVFFPWLYVVAWLDVANVGSRMDLLSAGCSRNDSLYLVQYLASDGKSRCSLRKRGDHYQLPKEALPPGQYRLSAILANTHMNGLPPPVGWAPYNQPVEASVCFRIVASTTPTTQTDSK